MLFAFIGLVATLTIWSSIASLPMTAVTPRDGFGRRLAGSIMASLVTIGAYEVTKEVVITANKTSDYLYRYLETEDLPVEVLAPLPDSVSSRLPTFELWLAVPPAKLAYLHDLRNAVEKHDTLNKRTLWYLLNTLPSRCSSAAVAVPGATPTHRADSLSPANSLEFLSAGAYLGLILASLALGRCLGARYLAPASDDDSLALLPVGASPALPHRVVTGLQWEVRTEFVNGLPLMWASQPYISSELLCWIAETENIHLPNPQPDHTTKRQTEARPGPQRQALVPRRLANISPFVLIQIVRLLASALEGWTPASPETGSQPCLDSAEPLREPKKKKRNRPGQKQRRRQWIRDMHAMQDKAIQEAEGKSQS
ncbi:hypothetical protein GTR04_3914 [Trichophyton interdigitale]|uniref:Uncharacterized protein n=2 Tax=Trichophyton TaxID=5550 RepID=A0A9P4YI68_9EURO|nr:hypothetical protein GY631_3682 [Trichophyton interdigitale]KAF3895299.1 hypothetical protein GY632_3323 [Trichophyton interdigitale]KAG8208684.1 hypothetical protein GTR04_3914 [Trichophyton interdigitale]